MGLGIDWSNQLHKPGRRRFDKRTVFAKQVDDIWTADRPSLYPIHIFDVSKKNEQLTEGVVDITARMEFSANVLANTQTYALVISD